MLKIIKFLGVEVEVEVFVLCVEVLSKVLFWFIFVKGVQVLVCFVWVVIVLVWLVVKWIIFIDVFFQFLWMLYYWNIFGVYVGWMFLVYFVVLIVFIYFVLFYKFKGLQSGFFKEF